MVKSREIGSVASVIRGLTGAEPPWVRLLGLLLAGDGALRALPGPRVGLGALAADREAHAVTATLVAADLDLAADVALHLTTEVALDRQVAGLDLARELDQLVLGECVDAGVRVDARRGQQLLGGGTADAVDVGECDLDALLTREVDTDESCMVVPSVSATGVSRRTSQVGA